MSAIQRLISFFVPNPSRASVTSLTHLPIRLGFGYSVRVWVWLWVRVGRRGGEEPKEARQGVRHRLGVRGWQPMD